MSRTITLGPSFTSNHVQVLGASITVDPFEYFQFKASQDYKLIYVSTQGAVIEGSPCKRLVDYSHDLFYLNLPYMYYFFTPYQEAYGHLAISHILGSWSTVKTDQDRMFILPLPNMYDYRPCYYSNRVVSMEKGKTANPRYLIDPRSKEYPSFEIVVHSHLNAFWHSFGNDDAIELHEENTTFSKLTGMFDREAHKAPSGYCEGNDLMYEALTVWESLGKKELQKLSWYKTDCIASILYESGKFIIKR